jgi:hypothetical protein
MGYKFVRLECYKGKQNINGSKKHFRSFYFAVKRLTSPENYNTLYQYALSLLSEPYRRYVFANSYYSYLRGKYKSLDIEWLKMEVDRLNKEAETYKPKPVKFKINPRGAFSEAKVNRGFSNRPTFESSKKINTKAIKIGKTS